MSRIRSHTEQHKETKNGEEATGRRSHVASVGVRWERCKELKRAADHRAGSLASLYGSH